MLLASKSSNDVPDTYENNLETSDADDKEQKGVKRETSAAENAVIPGLSSSIQKTPRIKRNAAGEPTLKKNL